MRAPVAVQKLVLMAHLRGGVKMVQVGGLIRVVVAPRVLITPQLAAK